MAATPSLNGLPDRSYSKLVKIGLASPRETPKPTPEPVGHQLGAFLDNYVKSRVDITPQSLVVLGHTVRNLKDFFGADRPLNSISEGDADAWRLGNTPKIAQKHCLQIREEDSDPAVNPEEGTESGTAGSRFKSSEPVTGK